MSEIKFSEDHEWIQIEGDIGLVGDADRADRSEERV